jgi:hypothetical protein
VPFNPFRRGKKDDSTAPSGRQPATSRASTGERREGARGVRFDGLTEEWRLLGLIEIDGRLSDALNRREALAISEVSWAPADGSSGFTPVPGLRTVDPYDLIVILSGEESASEQDEAHRAASRLHKVAYDVALDLPPYKVLGTVHLFPGTEPQRLLERATELFLPVTDAHALFEGQRLGEPGMAVALVNRSYLKGVEQIDRRMLERIEPASGGEAGGPS